ncbi:hypothetical protein [uncultured Cohaesibacter sp.]|uniref:hypothetical protein n=1 Tax=uncultured Cohaesibacter sp. TaxID=1002546 RepID=UPI0029C9372B|nr:hypothetical protein [uncultured Cohaesibacter sp.]
MIAIIMYILLGIFVTLLLMLLVIPMIWRRAVRLTKKRLQAEMPMSYSELQAEKDHIRAEMAVDMRRLEVISNRRQEELANKSIKIDRLNVALDERASTILHHQEEIDSLKGTISEQIEESRQISSRLNDTRKELQQAHQTISDLEGDKDDLNKEIYYLETNVDEQKVELAAQMARIENLREEISSLTGLLNEQTGERSKAETQLGRKTGELDRTRERLSSLQEKVDGLQASLADKDSEIDNLKRQLERANQQHAMTGEESNTLLAEAEARRLEAETKIANLAMQLETRQKLEDGGNLSTVIKGLEEEKVTLQQELDKALESNSDLAEKLAALQEKLQAKEQQETPTGDLTEREQLLRDEIKQIATRLTEFTAARGQNKEALKATAIRAAQISETVEKAARGRSEVAARAADSPENGTGNGAGNKTRNETVNETGEQQKEGPAGNATVPKPADPWSQVFSLADQVRELEKSSS